MNTNHARRIRAYVALAFLSVSGFISLTILIDAMKYGETIEFYLGGMALADAIGALVIAVALLTWNAVTYAKPRYARNR